MSQPWMPLYVADYLADTRRLSTLEHGAYMLLIMDYWRNGNLPDDDERLSRIAGLQLSEWICVRIAIEPLFLPGWRHKRIDEELARSVEKSKKATKSAKNRWKNANEDADAMPTQCEGNADAMLSQPQSQLQASSSFHSEEAAAAAPEKISKEEIERRCEQAAGFGGLSGISKIVDLVESGADFEGRVLPVIRDAAQALRRKGDVPRNWLYFAVAIGDPDRKSPPKPAPPAEVSATVFVPHGSPAWQAWDDYGRRTKGSGYPSSVIVRGEPGWRFPTEFPPKDSEVAA